MNSIIIQLWYLTNDIFRQYAVFKCYYLYYQIYQISNFDMYVSFLLPYFNDINKFINYSFLLIQTEHLFQTYVILYYM